MSYQIFNEASLGKFIELIQNKVRSIVDNATVASAQKATNDSDGNAINTTYRKVADSYSQTEVEEIVEFWGSKYAVITTDDLISNYTQATLAELVGSCENVYLKITHNDPIAEYTGNRILNLYGFYGYDVEWGTQFGHDGMLLTTVVNTIDDHSGDGHISLSYNIVPTNTLTIVSTVNIAASAWDSTSKTATVSVSGVTADNAVDVAPAESSYDDYVNAGIRATAQSEGTDGNGTLTFTCKTIPTKAISVNIKVVSTKAITATRNVK